MEHIKNFYENLGNIHTSILVAFLTGFAFGMIQFDKLNIAVRIIIGIIFAVFISLLIWLLHKFLPDVLDISIMIRPIMTILLIVVFVAIINHNRK